jgi:hypothetical protein
MKAADEKQELAYHKALASQKFVATAMSQYDKEFDSQAYNMLLQ